LAFESVVVRRPFRKNNRLGPKQVETECISVHVLASFDIVHTHAHMINCSDIRLRRRSNYGEQNAE